MKRGVVTEEMMALHRESNELVFRLYAYGSDHTCRPDVDAFPMAGVFSDFGGNADKRAGERGELLAGRMEELCSVKDEQRGSRAGNRRAY